MGSRYTDYESFETSGDHDATAGAERLVRTRACDDHPAGGIKNYLDYLEYAVEVRVLSLKVLSESVVLDAGAAKLALASRVVPTAEACAELRTARRAPLCVSLKVPRVR